MNWRHLKALLSGITLVSFVAGCRTDTQVAPVGSANAGAVKDTLGSATTDKATEPRLELGPSRVKSTSEERTIHFAWRPARGSEGAYAQRELEDQHRLILSRGVERGGTYPVVIGLHGQPRRGQAPRSYAFPRVVAEVSRELLEQGAIMPHVLVTPVFRFEGQNWPQFELPAFLQRIEQILSEQGIRTEGVYLFGHSGAAGCGGQGMNAAASISPKAVGFFDTCVGAGLVRAVKELDRRRIPTLILHSVETAGFQPRPPQEYDPHFDFGRVYSLMGLRPSECPARLPEAPLRTLAYRCASSAAATTRALVIDTGEGEKAHDAVVRVGMRYFLREYLSATAAPIPSHGSTDAAPAARARSAEKSD